VSVEAARLVCPFVVAALIYSCSGAVNEIARVPHDAGVHNAPSGLDAADPGVDADNTEDAVADSILAFDTAGQYAPDALDAPAVPTCPQAVGAWTATMPPFYNTNYIVTFDISAQIATTGGAVDITWTSPGVNPYTGPGVFSVATCSLAESYPALCASSTAAGNGVQCGDTSSSGQDLCPGGNGLTVSFDPPTLSWWDAHGCVNGLNCSSCVEHQATSVVQN
jgi:hypothetical protein